MDNIIISYLIKVAVSIALFYGVYMLCLRNDTFLKLRRFFFLFAIVFSLIFPAFNIEIPLGNDSSIQIPTYWLSEMDTNPVVKNGISTSANLWAILLAVLFTVSVICTLKFIIQLFSVVKLRVDNESEKISSYRIIKMKDKKVSPFSFFRWIFISPDDHNKQKLDEIITHEQAHVRQLHSIDTIVSELLCILFWWNPFAWLMKKEIKINLEYLADQGVLQAGYDSKEYQYILLQVSNKNTSGPAIISYFNVSRLKKRIAMMNRKDSPALASFKYLLIVPAGIFLLLGNAVQASSEPINISHEVLADVFAPSPTNTEATDVNNTKTGQIKSLAASQADDSKPFITVERMPGYPGGERDLKKFIRTNLKYPADAIKNNIQGRVIVRFIVDETGKIKNAEIVKGIHSSCDAEALRVIKNMPDWIPGKQDGKNVPVYFNMPIQFKMTGKVNNGSNLHTSLKNKNIV